MSVINEKWYDEAVFYHIYPLGLTGAPKENKDGVVVHRLEKLKAWIPHLKKLGINAIYIGPLFESSTHGYDTKDYRRVDSRLGDNNDFKKFVELAHDNGIKVVVDGVFNHTGREFFAFQDILKNRSASPYCSWYKNISFDWSSPYNDGVGYEAWRGCYELVNLNPWEPAVREYIFDTIDMWIDEFDIDGIRLDCADCLEDFFIEEMRRRADAHKKDFWLMGEVIHGNYGSYISDNKLNSVTDYQLHKGLYSGHNDHNYFEIAHTIRYLFGIGGQCPGTHLYSFADNHDVDRLASKVNIAGHMKLIYTLIYTLPGIPSIYYGSEWGIQGKKEGASDDALRPELDVDYMSSNNQCAWLTEWITQLGKIHKLYAKCLAYGVYDELVLTNRQFAYARWTDEEGIITAVNNDENEAQIWIPIRQAQGVDMSALLMDEVYDVITGEKIKLENNHIHANLQPDESKIYVIGRKSPDIVNTSENNIEAVCGYENNSLHNDRDVAINTKSDNNGYDSLDVTGNISNTDNTDKDTLEYIKYSIDNKLVETDNDSDMAHSGYMRRNDRQVTDIEKIMEVLDSCTVCHVAMSQDDFPYVIPLSYGYEIEDDRMVLYFHSAMTGKKLNILRQNHNIAFEISHEKEIIYDNDNPCASGCLYESIIGFGSMEFVEEPHEKKHGLSLIMKRQTGQNVTFTDEQIKKVEVLKVAATDYTCKARYR